MTPLFSLSQDEKYLVVELRTPHIRLEKTEIFYEGKEFVFTSPPYFLRLFLPQPVVSSDSQSDTASYDAETSTFKVLVKKEVPGQEFAGLDMITQLLTPKGRTDATDLVELYENNPVSPVTVVEESPETASDFGYGFAGLKTGVVAKLREEIRLLLTTVDPDLVPKADRLQLCRDAEDNKFVADHYLADLYDSDYISPLVHFKPNWHVAEFTVEERDRLKNLPKRQYNLSAESIQLALYSLLDILFAYAYELRTTEGEFNVESSWTIATLSSTLTGFVHFDNLLDVVKSAVRRSLCYPLYRRWDLVVKVEEDVKEILKSGVKSVLRCLLDVHRIFATAGDFRYILNDLYITDYCVWLQSLEESRLSFLLIELSEIHLTKADVHFGLEDLEMLAAMESLKISTQAKRDVDELQLHTGAEVLNYVGQFADGTEEKEQNDHHRHEQLDSDDSDN